MTLSTLEKQVAQLEEKVQAQPRGGVSLWLAGLLKSPVENEVILNAATFLILKDILEEPEPHLWERLVARVFAPEGDESWKDWPDARLWFVAAYQCLETEEFDDDDGKEAACYLARVYFEVFHHGAPLPENKHQRVLREDELNDLFIRPLMARACPEIDRYSTATHKAWLQRLMDAPESQEPESSLASLREYVQGIQQKEVAR
jgi:hypothetical protein